MTRRDWIVVNATSQQVECLRCGKSEPLKMPALVTAFCLRLQAFEEEHKECKP